MKDKKKVKQGKKNRAAGLRFETKVRADIIAKGWIVDKWTNNVKFEEVEWKENKELGIKKGTKQILTDYGKLVPAKHKYRGTGIPMAMGTGFPDFIAFRTDKKTKMMYGHISSPVPEIVGYASLIIGVECKSNGYLKPEEKEKCQWYLDNNTFSKIFIASKGDKRGEIIYKEFK